MKRKCSRKSFFLLFAMTPVFLSCRTTNPSVTQVKSASLPPLGEEYSVPPPDEAQLTEVISQMFQGIVEAGYQSRKDSADPRPARRDAHAKQHACAAAEFKVIQGLPADLRYGVFEKAKTYKAFVRFSSGSPFLKDDREGDAHGMAIKLLNVNGAMALSREEAGEEYNTQDFVMIDHPVFFMRTAHTYIPFVKAQSEGPAGFGKFLQENPYEGALAVATGTKKPESSLLQAYFSQTAYKLGSNAMKFTARPCANQNLLSLPPSERGPDYLRDTIAKQMENTEICYDFMVQRQLDPQAMPVEDPTIEWPAEWNGKPTYQKVATISIPMQAATSDEHLRACEDMSFTPWHSLQVQKPIGGINRVRKQVYIETAKHRHGLNKANFFQPNESDWQNFLKTSAYSP